MSTKSQNAKNFIKDAGVKNQLFVFAGYNPNPSLSDTNETSINVWNYSDFSVRVGQNSLMPVVPFIKWSSRKPYQPWYSTKPNNGNYYAYNDQNGYVYLCISNNADNRSDFGGVNPSTIRPTHTAGIQSYSDGYSWKPLYRITSSLERFVSTSWLPVISFDLFDNEPQKNLNQLTKQFCGDFGTGDTGYCAIYAKTALNTDDDAGTNEFERGDLFSVGSNMSCSECFYLLHLNEKFASVFYDTNTSIPSTIEIVDNYDTITNLIQANQISTASPYYYLNEINQNDNLDEGSLISVFINLSGFSTSQLICSVPDPEIAVTSNTGNGGRIKLKTKILNNQHIINGIEIIQRGSGYKDIKLSIDENLIEVDSLMITSVIDVNIDTLDGLGFDPIDVLNAQHVMIDARIEKKTIESSNIYIPDQLNFFGLIQNPNSTVGTNIITSGTNKNKKLDYIYRTTVLAEVGNNTNIADLPVSGEEYNTNIPTNIELTGLSNTTNGILIGGVAPTAEGGVATNTTRVELKNVNYGKYDYLEGLTFSSLDGSSVNYVTAVVAAPEFIQYSGKILLSKKENANLNISDTESVIIRINMVKGM